MACIPRSLLYTVDPNLVLVSFKTPFWCLSPLAALTKSRSIHELFPDQLHLNGICHPSPNSRRGGGVTGFPIHWRSFFPISADSTSSWNHHKWLPLISGEFLLGDPTRCFCPLTTPRVIGAHNHSIVRSLRWLEYQTPFDLTRHWPAIRS